jgi:uncharacterized protein YkwD
VKSLAVAALVLISACTAPGRGPQQVGTQPSWREPQVVTTVAPAGKPVVFAPDGQGVTRYNEAVQTAPPSPLGDAVYAAVKDAATKMHLPPPIADTRLFRACSELAAIVPEEGVVGYSLVEFALQRNGIVEPSPHLLVVWGDISQPQVIVDQLRPKLAEILADGATARLGVGAVKRLADGTGAVVFALQGSGLATSPIPRAVPAYGSFPIDAVVDARYHDPEVFVTHDDGTTERLALRAGRASAFTSSVECGAHNGKQQVEITAADAAGSTVLANFPVWCGGAPPDSMTLEANDDSAVTTAGDAEKRLLALINRDRVAARLPELAWDEGIANVARAHSEDMRRTKIVAHISPTTGSASDRVRAADIRTAVVLENVARAYGVNEAHEGLMNSPGHRANIMSASATHIGIGVVLGDDVSGRREMFVTQVFIRVPPKIDYAQTADFVRARMSAARPSVANDARLTSVAQGLAEQLAAGVSRDAAWPAVRKQLDHAGGTWARVGSVVEAVAELDSLDGKALLGDQHPDDIGVGVAQGKHPEIGDNAIYIVVLMAERVNGQPPAPAQPKK